MKRIFGVIGALALMLVLALPVSANNSGQCPGFQNNIPTNDGSIVLSAGTSFCVHASNDNTGIQTADGVHDLDWYIAATILNNGGQVPTISNYVIYSTASSTPSSQPSEEPSSTPSATPVVTPDPSPTSSFVHETACPAPHGSPCGPFASAIPTAPSTDVATPAGPVSSNIAFAVLALSIIIGAALMSLRLNKR